MKFIGISWTMEEQVECLKNNLIALANNEKAFLNKKRNPRFQKHLDNLENIGTSAEVFFFNFNEAQKFYFEHSDALIKHIQNKHKRLFYAETEKEAQSA